MLHVLNASLAMADSSDHIMHVMTMFHLLGLQFMSDFPVATSESQV